MVVCVTRSITGRGSRRSAIRRAKPTTPPCADVAIHTPARSAPSAIGFSESSSPCSKTTRSTTLRNAALAWHLRPWSKSRETLDKRWGVLSRVIDMKHLNLRPYAHLARANAEAKRTPKHREFIVYGRGCG